MERSSDGPAAQTLHIAGASTIYSAQHLLRNVLLLCFATFAVQSAAVHCNIGNLSCCDADENLSRCCRTQLMGTFLEPSKPKDIRTLLLFGNFLQHIPKPTNLFGVSYTFATGRRSGFCQFPLYLCHYCSLHKYAFLISEAV